MHAVTREFRELESAQMITENMGQHKRGQRYFQKSFKTTTTTKKVCFALRLQRHRDKWGILKCFSLGKHTLIHAEAEVRCELIAEPKAVQLYG